MSSLQNNLTNSYQPIANKIFASLVKESVKRNTQEKLINRANFHFRANARALQDYKGAEVLIAGAAGTGKSLACLSKLHNAALENPGMRALIVRKTRESLTETGLVTYENHVLDEKCPLKEGPKRNFRQVYRYPNGSEIVVGGLDKATKIMSSEYDLIFVQEATEITEEDWQALITRLRNGKMPYQQILADCNPDAPGHWLKVRCDSGKTLLLNSTHKDNPILWDEPKQEWTSQGIAYTEKLAALTGAQKDRLYLGKWSQASGLVYDEWQDGGENGNVTEDADYTPGYGDIYWAVDDGYSGERDEQTKYFKANSHPRVFLLCQLRPDGTLCVFEESFAVKLLDREHLAEVLALPYPRPTMAAVDRSASTLKREIYNAGISYQNGANSVDESIKEMRRWIALDSNDRRRLLVHPRCTKVRLEFVSYRYDPDTAKPVKDYDHSMDAIRYLIHTLRYN